MRIKTLAIVLAAIVCRDGSRHHHSGGTHDTRARPRRRSSVLGKPDAAKGTPVVFGADNMNVSAGRRPSPSRSEAANAMVDYINAYKGGLDGHPIKVDWCATDGTPAQSSQLRQAADRRSSGGDPRRQRPGYGADTIPAYAKAHLAYLGGMDFTPVENTASNSVIFTDTAQLGNVHRR